MLGKVYIVGSGPGDPELLTLKAARLIQQADVLLYDRLVHPDVLNLAKKDCELVYVGKEEGKHLIPQDDINQFLVYYAKKAQVVVRLKGGDPFVFGRGGEEILYLQEHHIPFELVPGITSPLSVPAYAGIPVTHRGIASSYAVITGHQAPEEDRDLDWESFKGIDTLVFVMGVTHRQEIARKLISVGRDPHEPVAFIEKGTTKEQNVIVTHLKEVADYPPQVKSPAIFIIGKVVRLRQKLSFEVTKQFSMIPFSKKGEQCFVPLFEGELL